MSHKQEGAISSLPTWCLTAREITCGITADRTGMALRVTPIKRVGPDTFQLFELTSTAELRELLKPWNISFRIEDLGSQSFVQIGDPRVEVVGEPLTPPMMAGRGMIGWGRMEKALPMYTEDSAKRDAVSLWNSALTGEGRSGSFIHQARSVFDKLQAIIRRRAFLERRIHRFINEHRYLVLPPFKQCFFEHFLFLGEEKRKADFILEREAGLPALLIELESPVHKVFRANGDWTTEVNHAKGQIAEWLRFIQQAPDRNASEDLAFLLGPTQRMIIIGRGVEERQKLLDSRFTDTIVWTYDLLIEEARARWNSTVEEQHRLLGLPPERPF
ncbi:MAG: Shedu anti-phage system protein SduA domain-containing protein [Candidatus Helarchaeota archaeon]